MNQSLLHKTGHHRHKSIEQDRMFKLFKHSMQGYNNSINF